MAKGDFSVQVVGLDKLTSRLLAMGLASKPVVRGAMKAGGRIIQAAMQANIHDGPGTRHPSGMLRRSIKVRMRSRQGDIRAYVGTSSISSLFTGKTFYGGFVEYGHGIGSRKLGKSRKRVAPHPFRAPAVKQKRDQAAAVILQQIEDGLRRAGA